MSVYINTKHELSPYNFWQTIVEMSFRLFARCLPFAHYNYINCVLIMDKLLGMAKGQFFRRCFHGRSFEKKDGANRR